MIQTSSTIQIIIYFSPSLRNGAVHRYIYVCVFSLLCEEEILPSIHLRDFGASKHNLLAHTRTATAHGLHVLVVVFVGIAAAHIAHIACPFRWHWVH